MSKDRIGDFEVVVHGIDHPDYFPGCGTAFTKFSGVVTGAASNPRETFEDALEQLAEQGYDITEDLKLRMVHSVRTTRCRTFPLRPQAKGDQMYYISIRYNQTGWYEVIVGNVGKVHDGYDKDDAEKQYKLYVGDSKNGVGRASGEAVTLYCDGEVVQEYQPPSEDEVMDDVNGVSTDPAQHSS